VVAHLNLIRRLDADRLVACLAANDNATAARPVGWWLETPRHVLRRPDAELEPIHHLAPRQNRYALSARAGEGRVATGSGMILPDAVIEQWFERLHRCAIHRTCQRISAMTMLAWTSQSVRQPLHSHWLSLT